MSDEHQLFDLQRLYELVKDHPLMGLSIKQRIEELQVKLYMTGKEDIITWQ